MTIRSYHEKEAARLHAKAEEYDKAAMICDQYLFSYYSQHAAKCERIARGHEDRIKEMDND